MNSQEIKSLFEEVFFEDEWEIKESIISRYGNDWPIFYLKRQSDKLKSKVACCKIHNYCIGTTIIDDIWELVLDTDIRMIIPGTSIDAKVVDSKAFVSLFKEKVEEYFKIKEMKVDFNRDINLMKNDPNKIVREYKLNKLGI